MRKAMEIPSPFGFSGAIHVATKGPFANDAYFTPQSEHLRFEGQREDAKDRLGFRLSRSSRRPLSALCLAQATDDICAMPVP